MKIDDKTFLINIECYNNPEETSISKQSIKKNNKPFSTSRSISDS